MYDYVRLCVAMHEYLWLCLTNYDYVWLCMTIMNMYNYIRLCMTMYEYMCLCMIMYEYVWLRWLCLTMYDYVWCMGERERAREILKKNSSFYKTFLNYQNFSSNVNFFTWCKCLILFILFNKPQLCLTLCTFVYLFLPLFTFVYLCLHLLPFVHLWSNDASMHKFCACFLTKVTRLSGNLPKVARLCEKSTVV